MCTTINCTICTRILLVRTAMRNGSAWSTSGTFRSTLSLVLSSSGDPPFSTKCLTIDLNTNSTRFALSMVLYYYLLLTRPVTFGLIYTRGYFTREFGWIAGMSIWILTLPIFPISVLLPLMIYRRIKEMFVAGWMTKGPGAIFFTRPQGLAQGIVWDMWLFLGMYTSSFLMTGTDPTAMKHIEYDAVANKWFWRDLFKRADVRYPRNMATWRDGKLTVHHAFQPDDKIIAKLTDSYLGIGDTVMTCGTDWTNDEDLTTKLRDLYGDKEAFLTEFVECRKSLGVHQLDVLTARIEGQIQVLRVIYWGDCTGKTSHSATTGYMCDARVEKVTSATSWYSPTYKNQKINMIGQTLPGMAEAVRDCVAAHEACKTPWLGVIGWDVSFTERGRPVFFEGNYGISRLRRHCFSSIWALIETIRVLAPIGRRI